MHDANDSRGGIVCLVFVEDHRTDRHQFAVRRECDAMRAAVRFDADSANLRAVQGIPDDLAGSRLLASRQLPALASRFPSGEKATASA